MIFLPADDIEQGWSAKRGELAGLSNLLGGEGGRLRLYVNGFGTWTIS